MMEPTMTLNLTSSLKDHKLAEAEEVVVETIEEVVDAVVKIQILEEVENKNLRNKMTTKMLFSLRLTRIKQMILIQLLLTKVLNQLKVSKKKKRSRMIKFKKNKEIQWL